MESKKTILLAFLLNLSFSIFEFIGGIFTCSVAIISDAVHDLGDAVSIGISFLFEKKSEKSPDEKYTYGYARFSLLGSIITNLILLLGSAMVIYNAVRRIIAPVQINYDGMIVFAVVGVCVNLCAALFTRRGESLNQKAVNLHLLEDALGWIVVLVGAIVMRFTDISIIDPIMSICVAIFIFISASKNLNEVIDIFLERTPRNINVDEIRTHLLRIDGIANVHHIHVRSIDGQHHYATMHIVFNGNAQAIKAQVREELSEHGIVHTTLELEEEGEACCAKECRLDFHPNSSHHHHHSH